MRNLIIFTLFITFSVTFVALTGCTGSATSSGNATGARYMGAAVRKERHSTAYNDESMTAHFTTFVDDPENPYDFYSIRVEDGRPDSCLMCHSDTYDSWLKTRHASAIKIKAVATPPLSINRSAKAPVPSAIPAIMGLIGITKNIYSKASTDELISVP